MGWCARGYYRRTVKVDGKCRCRYIGKGSIAEAVAQMVAEQQAERARARKALAQDQADAQVLDDILAPVDELADLIARAALVTAGCHNHKGEWRQRRG